MNNPLRFKTKEELATFAITYFLQHHQTPRVKRTQVSGKLLPQGACFVTVYVGGELRGCIGNHQPYEPLYQTVVRNAIEAASCDFRFFPIQKQDLAKLQVSVSVLTPLAPFGAETSTGLMKCLQTEKPGLFLENGRNRALFLPQVWEELKTPKAFLGQLCLKAGLTPDCWKDKNTKYWTFSIRKDV